MEPQIRPKKAKRSRSHSRRSLRKKHYHKSRSRSRRRSKQHRTQHGKCESSDCDSLPPERKRSKHHSRTSRRSSRSKSYNRNHKHSQLRSHDRRKPHQNRHRNNDLHKSREEYDDISDTEHGSFDDQVSQLSSFDRHRERDFKKKNKRKRLVMSPSNRGYKKTTVDIYSSDSNDSMDSDYSDYEPKRTKKRDKLATRIAKSVLKKLSEASSKHKLSPLKRITDKMESNERMLSEHSTKKEAIKASTSKRITKTCTVSTEEWKDSFDIEPNAEIDDEIIHKVVAESSIKKGDASAKEVVPNLSFDLDTVKQALATVKRNESLYSECSLQAPNADNQQCNPVVQPPNHQWAFAQSNCSQSNKDPRLQRLREQSEQGLHHQSSTQTSYSHYPIRTPYSPIYDERFRPNESYMSSPLIPGYEHASFSSMPYQDSIEFSSMPYQHPIQSHRLTSPTLSDYNKRFAKMREYVASRNNEFERQNYDHSKMARESSNAFIKRTETQMTYPRGHTGKQRNVPYANYGEYRRSRQAIISSTSTIAETVTCVNAYPQLRSVSGNNKTTNSKLNFKVQESTRDVDGSTEIQTKYYANASNNSKLQESVNINEYGKNSTSTAKFNFKFPEKAKNIKFNEVDTTDDWDLETDDSESQNNSNIEENVNSFSKEKLEPQDSNEKSNNFNEAKISSRSLNSNSSVSNAGSNNLTSTAKFNSEIPKKPIKLNGGDTTDNWDSEAEVDGSSDQNNSEIGENINSYSEEKLEPQSSNQKSNNFNKATVSPRSVNSSCSADNSCEKNSTSTTKFNFKIPKISISKTTDINESDTTDNWDSEAKHDAGSESQNISSIEENGNSFNEETIEPQSSSNNFKKQIVKPIVSSRSINSSSYVCNAGVKNSTSPTKFNFKIPKLTIRKLKISKSDTTDNLDSEANIATGSESKNNASIEENKENEESPVVTSSSISTLTDVQRKRDTIAKLKELFSTPMSLDTLSTVKAAIEKLTKETDAEGIEGLVKPKQNKKTKKRKNELDRLNEDIDASFIRDDVLNATGKRICSQNTNYALGDSPEDETKHKIQTMDDFNIQKNSKFFVFNCMLMIHPMS